MRNPDPPNYFASKYSLPHVAAALVVNGGTGYGSVDDAALKSPAIAALRHRVHITDDAVLSAMAPQQKPARVTLTLKDGRQSTHTVDSPRGDCLRPYDESEIRAKFRELAGITIKPEGVAEIEQAVNRCDQLTSVGDLTALMRRHGRD